MTKKQAIKFFGSVQRLADALGIPRQTVYAWKFRPPIPRQYQIAAVSGGELKVDGVKK